MRVLRRVAWLAAVAGTLVLGWRFAAENSSRVPVDYLVVRYEDLALWAALLGAFAGGAGLVGLLALYQLAKQGLVVRRYRKAVQALEAEVHQLRSLPLRDDGTEGAGPAAERGPEALARGA
jgi:uncharacterized integral membrane protein